MAQKRATLIAALRERLIGADYTRYADRQLACELAFWLFVQDEPEEAVAVCRSLWSFMGDSPEAEYVLALESRLARPDKRARNALRRMDFDKDRRNGGLLSRTPLRPDDRKGRLQELMEQVFVSAIGGGPRMPVRQVEGWLEANKTQLRQLAQPGRKR